MLVVKADGSRQEFEIEKIVTLCMNAGLARAQAERVAATIASHATDGISTKEIFTRVMREVGSEDVRGMYWLYVRTAIAALDPVVFEWYVGKILAFHGYRCSQNQIVSGKYVEHQVDVIASLADASFMIECKHHFNPHRFTGLGTCLQVAARLEDINAASHRFAAGWIITNNKFSQHARKYASGFGLRITGWRCEGELALNKLVEAPELFPINVLPLESGLLHRMLQNHRITLGDLTHAHDLPLDIRKLVEEILGK